MIKEKCKAPSVSVQKVLLLLQLPPCETMFTKNLSDILNSLRQKFLLEEESRVKFKGPLNMMFELEAEERGAGRIT